jgi:alpha-amylase/alpha-mannosidase (GH57 family)
MNGYICIHGHFYQPPRENPWLERIEVQDSAHPYHDWNARVHAECYAPNAVSRILDERSRITAIVNNYEHISFNFGPTLLSWIAENDPDIYRKIIQADRISVARHGGHGNAIAQAYNHIIMPLANRRDRITQIRWGIASFRRHFDRPPEGLWLPETAVDLETLEIVAEHGIRFTILAPRQARRVRPLNALRWQDVSDGSIDTTIPYLVRLPSGDSLAVFFYNGEIAHDLAFGGLLQNAETFAKRLFHALPAGRPTPPLVHVATDGETYGHHHRFGDMALAYALEQVRKNPDVGLTNYGEYLALFPPAQEVEIAGHSSWSCVHGVERWRGDCGCRAGGNPDWNQKWRQTLREGLDWLRHELISIYTRQAKPLFRNPWGARDDYLEVIMDRSAAVKDGFLQRHAARSLSARQRCLAWEMLEMQRNAMLMYTSCGWFFDEISGIEAVQVMSYAARAIELAERAAGVSLEKEFIERLSRAQSNISGMGTGADVYRKFALAAKAHLREVAIHCAISSFFENYQQKNILGCYTIELKEYAKQRHEHTVAGVGMLHARSMITEEEASFLFAALQQEPHDYYCTVKGCYATAAESSAMTEPCLAGKHSYAGLTEELFASLADKGPSAALHVIDRYLGKERYTIKDLFKDEQEQLLNIVLEGEIEFVGKTLEIVYSRTAFLTAILEECGHRIPPPFTLAAEITLKRKLVNALASRKSTPETIRLLLDEIGRWCITLDHDWLERTLRAHIDKEMVEVRLDPRPGLLKQMNAKLSMLYLFPVQVNLWQAQNIYFDLLQSLYPEKKKAADSGDAEAGHWLGEFLRLGAGLFINVENVMAAATNGAAAGENGQE